MYYPYTVPIPSAQGVLVRKKKDDKKDLTRYVDYTYERRYDKNKKYSVPRKTVIGKVDPEDETRMYPNPSFFTYFPDSEAREENDENDIPENLRSSCLNAGAFLVMRRIIREYHLDTFVGNILGDNAAFVLDLAMYCIITENNAAQYFPDYEYNHPLLSKNMKIRNDEDVCRLLSSITHDDCAAFLNEWNDRVDKEQRIYLAYDSTNKHCQAGEIIIAEFGHPKDGVEKSIINYTVGYDCNNRKPLFYEDYFGSVPDIAELQYMVDKCVGYGYRKLSFILDRGYFSKANLHYLKSKGYAWIIMMKGKQELVRTLIREVADTFEKKRNYAIKRYRANGITVKRKLFPNDDYEVYMHVIYKADKYSAEREQLENSIEGMEKILKKHIGKQFNPSKEIEKYFDLYFHTKTGVLVTYAEKENAVDEEMKYCGYFVIVTLEEMTAKEALTLYKGRDAQEKLFRGDKSFTSGSAYRTHSQESAESKIFIEFLAMIIRNRIYTSLKDEEEERETNLNYMNVTAAVKQLEHIQMIRERGSQYHLDSACTKTQKTILSAFDLKERDIRDYIKELNKNIPEVADLKAVR